MTDEIKRVAEDILLNWYEMNGVTVGYSCTDQSELKRRIIKALLAERRKAYEECARIAEDYSVADLSKDAQWRLACNKNVGAKEPYIGTDITNGFDEATYYIAQEIRKRMERNK